MPEKSKLAFGAEPARRQYRLRLARYKALAEAVAAYLGERPRDAPKADLLDIGVGSGRSMRFLEAQGVADRLVFHGVDNDDRRLGRVYAAQRWQLSKADLTQGLPFPDEHFDLCLCEQVLEHLAEPDGAVVEIARVLRPGGLALIGVPVFPPGIAHLRRVGVMALDRGFGVQRPHLQTFTTMSLTALLRRHGLQVDQLYGVRVISGGLLAPLEDCAWWYNFNRAMGRTFPWLCTEVQCVARKESTR